MPDLTIAATLTFGDSTTSGAVPCREPLNFTVTYTEKSDKTVAIAASQTDQSITFDSVTAPKFVFVQCITTDVTIAVDDGVSADPTPSALKAGDGWLMIANNDGQVINEILVTTPASPATGAVVRVLAVE
jgi:hypothetical protein